MSVWSARSCIHCTVVETTMYYDGARSWTSTGFLPALWGTGPGPRSTHLPSVRVTYSSISAALTDGCAVRSSQPHPSRRQQSWACEERRTR